MTGAMPSDHQQRLIAGYVLGDLDPEEAQAFAQQLIADPTLRQEVDRMQQALEAAFLPPEVSPPAALRAAILEAHRQPPAAANPLRQRHALLDQPRRWWMGGLGAVAAAAIAALSLSNLLLWQALREARLATVDVPTLAISLAPIEGDLPAQATVTLNPSRLEGTLTVENLPPLPNGQVYVLWTVLTDNAAFTTDAKNAILTQVFTVDAQGNRSTSIVVPPAFRDPDLVTAMAITVENADAPQRHESPPLLIESL
ncbi:MAG: anti-sigma factor domain-containing protein [Nodosilinea sp.]